ncbi:uncharacterized protein J3D65DRAFT_635393 [Phyllosticta citribraziliensis]|uniref:Uncharacterized protein n=1 Tax=Phyllosticta citribraziliensis TaxID=989973 RepID=A0ABR1L9T3_9PEZI
MPMAFWILKSFAAMGNRTVSLLSSVAAESTCERKSPALSIDWLVTGTTPTRVSRPALKANDLVHLTFSGTPWDAWGELLLGKTPR